MFFSPFSITITTLGEERANLVLFVRLFGLCMFRFVGFLFLLGSEKGCGLWLWHSLDFSLTFFAVMSNCDPEGRILVSVPYTLDILFFLQTFHFLKWMFENEVTSTAEVHYIVLTIPRRLVTSFRSATSTLTIVYRDVQYSLCISNTWKVSIFIFPAGRIRVCEIRFAITGIISGNSYPVCKKSIYLYIPIIWN